MRFTMNVVMMAVIAAVANLHAADAFVPSSQLRCATNPTVRPPSAFLRSAPVASASSTDTDAAAGVAEAETPNYNAVEVAKKGGRGVATSSEQAFQQNLSLGAPPARPMGGHFLTKGGVQVTSHIEPLEFTEQGQAGRQATTAASAVEHLVDALDHQRGVLLQSSYEFPGRYARWSLGFVDPPLEVSGRADRCTIRALNQRGRILMPAIQRAMEALKAEGTLSAVQVFEDANATGELPQTVKLDLTVVPPPEVGTFSEEERSRQPSLFSVVRALIDLFSYNDGDGQLGLYGAFGYDLTFSFERINLSQERDDEQRDLVLYLPDTITVVDQNKHDAWTVHYEFCVDQKSTQGLERVGDKAPFEAFQEGQPFSPRDTPENEFTNSVEKAKGEFKVGNLFEAVLSQTFREKLNDKTPPSKVFRRLRARNPAPYGFMINLGEQEYLVGASPEMFVRCETTDNNNYRPGAIRVETCPISGTVARGSDALEDSQRVKSLMMNAKEESELTMCTDVDRNDKSRICEPGSVQVIGRRQIEMYSRLIHTVDHVEGYLRPEFDALDAFLCHTWAVTVTGAPKTWAIQFVEDNERSQRCWYGGAVGMVGFDGGMNTGLTLRTVRIKNGVAEVRAGATLLYDSDPAAEEQETELKASAMIDALVQAGPEDTITVADGDMLMVPDRVGTGMDIVLVDHEDSFVHTLGNYLRQTGANVKTLRSGPATRKTLEDMALAGNAPDMVVLSPGPGNPSDFGLSDTIEILAKYKIPGFGVCLGLQGMVEHFGGKLGVLGYPMHGKPSTISLTEAGMSDDSIFASLPPSFEVARYHSLHGILDEIPDELEVIALTDDNIVMGIQHKTLPFGAVQFHPESILTNPAHGMIILENALTKLKRKEESLASPSGAALVAQFELQATDDLRQQCEEAGLATRGSKSELVVRLALWAHKSAEYNAGRLDLESMAVPDLQELKQGLSLKGTTQNRQGLLDVLQACLQAP